MAIVLLIINYRKFNLKFIEFTQVEQDWKFYLYISMYLKSLNSALFIKVYFIFLHQNALFMEIIERPVYLSHIISHLGKGMMIILVGQRRVGKSYMLKQLQFWLQANRNAANVVYVNKELHAFKDIVTADDLYGYATANLPEGGDNYLLIDEVQDITDYEDALRSLHAENRCQIVVTGSNAYIFSSELSTRLSGRYVEVPLHSLTYRDFMRCHGLQDSDKSLGSYLRVGGLPGL